MSRNLIFAILTLVLILGLYSGCVMKENFSFKNPIIPAGAQGSIKSKSF
jgi:hypothetical protein